RRIADFFDVRHNPDPRWSEEPISIDRRDFAGWRVNCGRVLLSLAALTIAPYAPWSSDRSMIERNGSRIRRHNRSGPIRGPARFDLPGAGAPLSGDGRRRGMGMDALTQVRQDHRKLEGLLERCEQLDGDDEERDVLLGQLQSTIRHHVDQEESILYTIFRERARRAEIDLGPLDRAIEQHRLIDRLSNELTDGGPGDTTLKARLTVLAEQVRTHLDDENTHLLTAIEDLIDDDTLIELGRRMEQRDRVIESRRQLATVVPGSPRTRWLAAAFGGLAAVGTALLAVLVRRRRPPPPPATGWRRIRRR
ncbi:MAG TPA: hemerythrin domain-containing protein, partial [Propionibacteriaceae bacterium]|nr:hemerythrin domain-containing protein [Propionibacteriaceae bacterium]